MKLDNGILSVTIADHGAEIRSVKKGDCEYMWCADEKWWGRCAPVLFPIVGGLKDKKCIIDGKEYSMGQHGFARDMDFELAEQTENSATFVLKSNEETLEKYPYEFALTIKYILDGQKLKVCWIVENKNDGEMLFSIGAHPAFNLRDGENYFSFDKEGDLSYHLIDEAGLYVKEPVYILKNDGYVPILKDMFNRDALIVEDNQARRVSLCGSDKKPYVTMTFTAPLFGLWSKPDGAPFVCIEPWYGRCDANDADGNFANKDHIQSLEAGGIFSAEYEIEFI